MTKINIFLFKKERNNKIKLVKQVLSREDKLIYAINPAYEVYLFQIRIKKKNVSVYEVIKPVSYTHLLLHRHLHKGSADDQSNETNKPTGNHSLVIH